MLILNSAQPDKKAFMKVLFAHGVYSLRQALRNIGYGLTGGRLIASSIKKSTHSQTALAINTNEHSACFARSFRVYCS